MLVLTRKVGEKINIGDDITLSVLEIDRKNVRLGIDAPKSVTVFRQEVYERINAVYPVNDLDKYLDQPLRLRGLLLYHG